MIVNFDKEYIFELSTGKLKNFYLELSLECKEFNLNIPMIRNSTTMYKLKISSGIKDFLTKEVNAKVYLYHKNNRFLIHSTTIQFEEEVKEDIKSEVDKKAIEIINESSTKNIELNLIFSIKQKIDLSSLVGDNYAKEKLNLKMKKLLKSLID